MQRDKADRRHARTHKRTHVHTHALKAVQSGDVSEPQIRPVNRACAAPAVCATWPQMKRCRWFGLQLEGVFHCSLSPSRRPTASRQPVLLAAVAISRRRRPSSLHQLLVCSGGGGGGGGGEGCAVRRHSVKSPRAPAGRLHLWRLEPPSLLCPPASLSPSACATTGGHSVRGLVIQPLKSSSCVRSVGKRVRLPGPGPPCRTGSS